MRFNSIDVNPNTAPVGIPALVVIFGSAKYALYIRLFPSMAISFIIISYSVIISCTMLGGATGSAPILYAASISSSASVSLLSSFI